MSRSHDGAQDDMGMDMPMPNGGGMEMNNSNGYGMMMMHMSFYWGEDAIVLFPGWPKQSIGMYILAIFFVFFIAMATEVLSILTLAVRSGTNPFLLGLTQSIVYAFRIALAYLVMLSVMSFNVGIFIAAVLGHAVGFFIAKVRALSKANKKAETGDSLANGSSKV